jgi:membrane protein required for beta-lactamase induction
VKTYRNKEIKRKGMKLMETVGAIFPIIFWIVILGGIGLGVYRLLKTKQK